MTKFVDFVRGDTLPDYFLDALNEFISTGVFNLVLTLANPTTLKIDAGTVNGQVGAAVEGQWRYITTTAMAAHPGGPPGNYDIWITARQNDFSGTPPNQDQTDYSFGLVIKPQLYVWTVSDPPLQRNIGYVYWNGSAITSIISPYAQVAADSVPIGSIMDWPYGSGDIPDNYILPYGQALSRHDFQDLHSLAQSAGYPHGAGDGSTTFNAPDFRGRTAIGKDDMGGGAANRVTAGESGMTGTQLGAVGGTESVALSVGQIPSHSHVVTDPGHIHAVSDPGHKHSEEGVHTSHNQSGGSPTSGGVGAEAQGRQTGSASANVAISSATTGISIAPSGGGSSPGHPNMQPSLVVNKIMRAA